MCFLENSYCLDGTLARWDEERTGIVEARLVLLSQYVPMEKVYCHMQNRLNTVRYDTIVQRGSSRYLLIEYHDVILKMFHNVDMPAC
jgi:hypothetical protein|mmetsp:Transcript_16496/g.30011  ORF Transcript_16496/g.30011 Transcript_16496/m.30011 type:complete len:87 (-) Transcript_16496:1883-2143(-)